MALAAKLREKPKLVLMANPPEPELAYIFRGPLAHYPKPVVEPRPNALDEPGLGIVDEASGLRLKPGASSPRAEAASEAPAPPRLDRGPIDFEAVLSSYPAVLRGGDEMVPACPGIPPFRISRVTLVPN
jgi:hypothetical protein